MHTVMKRLGLHYFGLLAVLLMTALPLSAQEEKEAGAPGRFGTGQDSIDCLKNLSLYREYARHRNYKDALPSWRWVYNNCPQASKNIYIDGVNMFRFFIENEKNPDIKEKYIDTLMMIYDKRMEMFGERGYVLGRKGVDLLRYRRDEQKYIQEGYDILGESVKLLKANTSPATFATYFTATLSLYKLNALSADQVLSNWAFIMPLLEQASQKNPKDTVITSVRDAIMFNFVNSGAATVESLTKYYEPLIKSRPDDVKLLKEATSAFSAIKEEEAPLNVQASELLYNKEPSAESAYKLAKVFYKQQKYDKAARYYQEAINNDSNNENKARYYYELAMVNYNQNNYSLARTNARTASQLKGNWADPYILVATLYAASSDICGGNEFEKKAVFWVAVDELIKAKNADPSAADKINDLLGQYSARFPNTEEAFFNGYTDGQTYTVGCWIGQNTIVRTRK